jgi:hypothetical protein
VLRFGGYVAKYLGDGVLVYFGCPLAHEDDAKRAVRSRSAAMMTLSPKRVRERDAAKVPRSGDFWFSVANGAPIPRFAGAFGDVDVAIDHLKVWQTPISKQRRPRRFPIFVPHPEQRDAVINLGAFPEAAAGFAATTRL